MMYICIFLSLAIPLGGQAIKLYLYLIRARYTSTTNARSNTGRSVPWTFYEWIVLCLWIVHILTLIVFSSWIQGKFLYYHLDLNNGELKCSIIDPSGKYDTNSWLERVIIYGLKYAPKIVKVTSQGIVLMYIFICVQLNNSKYDESLGSTLAYN